MAAVTVRGLDDGVRDRLRLRAARNGRSMEAEIREILAAAVEEPPGGKGLFVELMERFQDLGGVELDIPPGRHAPRYAIFDE